MILKILISKISLLTIVTSKFFVLEMPTLMIFPVTIGSESFWAESTRELLLNSVYSLMVSSRGFMWKSLFARPTLKFLSIADLYRAPIKPNKVAKLFEA